MPWLVSQVRSSLKPVCAARVRWTNSRYNVAEFRSQPLIAWSIQSVDQSPVQHMKPHTAVGRRIHQTRSRVTPCGLSFSTQELLKENHHIVVVVKMTKLACTNKLGCPQISKMWRRHSGRGLQLHGTRHIKQPQHIGCNP